MHTRRCTRITLCPWTYFREVHNYIHTVDSRLLRSYIHLVAICADGLVYITT